MSIVPLPRARLTAASESDHYTAADRPCSALARGITGWWSPIGSVSCSLPREHQGEHRARPLLGGRWLSYRW